MGDGIGGGEWRGIGQELAASCSFGKAGGAAVVQESAAGARTIAAIDEPDAKAVPVQGRLQGGHREQAFGGGGLGEQGGRNGRSDGQEKQDGDGDPIDIEITAMQSHV